MELFDSTETIPVSFSAWSSNYTDLIRLLCEHANIQENFCFYRYYFNYYCAIITDFYILVYFCKYVMAETYKYFGECKQDRT
jgi:hypothetical protein